jgi:hypothetical protein
MLVAAIEGPLPQPSRVTSDLRARTRNESFGCVMHDYRRPRPKHQRTITLPGFMTDKGMITWN